MDVTQYYAIAAGGCIALLFIVQTLIRISWLFIPCIALLRKFFLCPLLLRRHRLLGPWTRAQVAIELIYLAVNALCACFRVSTASNVATRARYLSLINMMPTYFEFHLSFVCTLLGISLPTYRLFHASTGTMSVILNVLHAVISAAAKPSLGWKRSEQVFQMIVSCCVLEELHSDWWYDLGSPFHDHAALTFIALISSDFVWALPSLSSEFGLYYSLRPVKTCSIKLKGATRISTDFWWHLFSHACDAMLHRSVQKLQLPSWLL